MKETKYGKKKRWLALGLGMVMIVSMLSGCKGGSGQGETQKENASVPQTEGKGIEDSKGAENDSSTTAGATYESKDYSAEKQIEISLAIWGVEEALSSNDEVLQKIETKFNIKLIPENITWEDYTEKIQLWAASGSLPDVFVGGFRTTANFRKWAQQGLLKEIPEDLSYYPTLEKYMDSEERDTCMVDGKTYCIFRQTFAEQSANARQTAIAYRWDLAQKRE